jgi:hypothetical protein
MTAGVAGSRAVAGEEAAGELAGRLVDVHPLERLRQREAHVLALRGGEDEVAAERDGLEQVAVAAAQAGVDARGELLAGQRAVFQGCRDLGEDRLHVGLGDLEVLAPRLLLVAGLQAALRADVQRQLVGPQQVQRPAHRPRLHERALLPEQGLDVRGGLDARPQRELRGRHDLGVQAADVGDDAERIHRPLGEVLARHAPGQDGLPPHRMPP